MAPKKSVGPAVGRITDFLRDSNGRFISARALHEYLLGGTDYPPLSYPSIQSVIEDYFPVQVIDLTLDD